MGIDLRIGVQSGYTVEDGAVLIWQEIKERKSVCN
jgi:hypothetical protein